MGIDYNIIGKRIKEARTSKNITQEFLAEKMDVSTGYISRIERGTAELSLKRLYEICDILKVSEGEVLSGSSSSSNNYLTSDFNNLLKNCPSEKIKLIYSIAEKIVNFK